MGTAAVTSSAAWITALLLGGQALLGLIHVRALPARGHSIRGMRWLLAGHAVIGLVLPPLTFVHAWSSMKLPGIRGTSAVGLWIATIALLLLVIQGSIGLSLLRSSKPQRINLRRQHFAMGVILVVLAGMHVLLNG